MLVEMGVRWCINEGYAYNAKLGRMHRFLLKAPTGVMVDHINGNKLDNRRENLRLCNGSQNQANRISVRGASLFKGVTWQRRATGGCWKAQIVVNGDTFFLGSYPTDLECAKAYNEAAVKYFGEYARVNDLSLPASTVTSSVRRQINKVSPSGFKGVTFDSRRGKWMAQLTSKGVVHIKRRFPTAIEAAKAYDETARRVYGNHAVTNLESSPERKKKHGSS